MFNPLIATAGVPVAAAGADQSRPSVGALDDASSVAVVVDGTPIRVVILALSGALALTALRWAGFKFNVGVSS